ncbi:MAG: DUF1330 domain-containing protein [bacterium]
MPVILTTTATLNAGGAASLERYAAAVMPLITAAGGRVLLRATLRETLVGTDIPDFIAVIQFPDADRIHALFDSDAYQAALSDRRRAFCNLRTFVSDPL